MTERPTFSSPTRDMSGLREIAQALSAAWDLDTTLDLIAHRTNHVMGVDSCSIYLLEPDGRTLRLRASTRLARGALGLASLQLGEGITGWAAEHGESVAIREAKKDPRFKLLPETNEEALKSLLAVPLRNQGRIIGAMNVQTAISHDFTEDEAEMLSLIGDLAAGALDRAMLHDKMSRRLDELTLLAKISETAASPGYPEEILAVVVEMAAKIVGAAGCSLQLIDPVEGELIIHASWGHSENYQKRPPMKLEEGIAGIVLREKKGMVVADVRTDPRYRFSDLARAEGLVSMLCVPLVVRDQAIGVMNCYSDHPVEFSQEQIALFSTLANQTALAIENSRLTANAAIVREMHHRIKNNLQTVAMLLQMQIHQLGVADKAIKPEPQEVREMLQTSISRILSIAAVHEVLAQEGFRMVDVKEASERIARLTAQHMVRPGFDVSIYVEGESLTLPSRPATSLALVINELLQNALEHAFPGRRNGVIRIVLSHSAEEVVVEVADDGIGLAEEPRDSLGWDIIRTLMKEDLRGSFEIARGHIGTKIRLRFPVPGSAREDK